MIDVLVFLQNPHSRAEAGQRWDDATWEAALWKSRSGIRLRDVLPATLDVVVRNCNPIATRHVSGLRRPDPVYIRREIARLSPRLLLLCGRQAGFVATMGYAIPFVTMPHPAFRLLYARDLDAIRDHVLSVLAGVSRA